MRFQPFGNQRIIGTNFQWCLGICQHTLLEHYEAQKNSVDNENTTLHILEGYVNRLCTGETMYCAVLDMKECMKEGRNKI